VVEMVMVYVVLAVNTRLVQLPGLFVLVEVRFINIKFVCNVPLESVDIVGLLSEQFVVVNFLKAIKEYIVLNILGFFVLLRGLFAVEDY